jgi:Flp pilus assembly protein TadD
VTFSALSPPSADDRLSVLHRRAVELLGAGAPSDALAALDTLLAMDPAHAEALNDSAVALIHLGRAEEAIDRLRRATNAQPDYAAAHHNLGLLLRQLGRSADAVAVFERSLALNPADATWWVDAGNALLEAGRPADALNAYDRALSCDARQSSAMLNRALALRALQRPNDAEAACRQAIDASPAFAEAWSNLGMLLLESDRVAEAEAALLQARALSPGSVAVQANLCALHLHERRRAEALALAHDITVHAPMAVEAWNALAHAQIELARFDDALATCDRALHLAPHDATAMMNRAFILLLRGDFGPGLEAYEARRRVTTQMGGGRRLPSPEWRGEALHGATVLLGDEQGAGDVLQFVRYAPLLKALGAGRLLVEAQPALAGLLASAPGVDAVVAAQGAVPPHDLHVPLLSIPRLVGTRVPSIPGQTPYLTAPDRPVGDIVRRAEGLRVGFSWSGNPRQNRNRLRSVPFPDLLQALDQDGIALFSLQVGGTRDATFTDAVRRGRVTDLGPELTTFDDTAAAMAACDVVVSVCTSVAHLAGALGRPTFTLLAHVADWRWLQDRDDSPWYPTMRLFRQAALDDWSAPLDALRRALAEKIATPADLRISPARPDPSASQVEGGTVQRDRVAAGIAPDVVRLMERATRLQVAGRGDEALAAYAEVLACAPTHAEALNNSGVLLAQRGESVEAEVRVHQATRAKPSYGQAHSNLGLLQRARGAASEALASFERACACEPHQTRWWLDLANQARELRRFDLALSAFEHAASLEPRNAAILADRALALHALGRVDDAIAACHEALRLDERHLSALSNLGTFLKERRRWAESEQAFSRGLHAWPDNAHLLSNFASLLHEIGRLDDARAMLQRVTSLHPGHAPGFSGLGGIHLEFGEYALARVAFEHARALEPGNPTVDWNLAVLSLLEGDFATGLPLFERRRVLANYQARVRKVPGDAWDGGPLQGRSIFIHEEQGLGDLIQFARYATALKARGAGRVVLEAPADAIRLLGTVPGVDEVVAHDATEASCDLHVPLMSTPFLCSTRLESIPAGTPYLRATHRPVVEVVRAVSARVKVGIVWGGNPAHPRDRFRSLPSLALLGALQHPEVALFSLQKGPPAADLLRYGALFGVRDLGPSLETLDDTAAAISALDVVVTVDTAVAHLAGALAAPTWTLLSFYNDWRWMLDRDDTPWYPSMRLFRQAAPLDWSRPLGQVRHALEQLVCAPADG